MFFFDDLESENANSDEVNNENQNDGSFLEDELENSNDLEGLSEEEGGGEDFDASVDDIDSENKANSSEKVKYSKKIEELELEIKALKDSNLRLLAEFDNFKKRTSKEKEGLYNSAQADCVETFLPLLDGLEKGFDLFDEKLDEEVAKGFQMLVDTCSNILKKLDVKIVGKKGELFDPRFHNAVQKLKVEGSDKNVIHEVFLKGYCKGDSVIRYAMVCVANPSE